jgi:methyl-accepting chemotaxis protein
MKLGPKLITAFIVVSILSLVVGVTGYTQITSVNDELNEITSNKVPAMDYSMEMGIAVWGQRDAAAAYMLGESEGKADFQDFKADFDDFATNSRDVYSDTSKIDEVATAHDTFSDLADDPSTGLFRRVDEKVQAIADAKQAMNDFDVAAQEMIGNLESLEDMQTVRKQTAQTNYADAVDAADAAMEMKIAVRQQQVAAKGYLLGKDTYNDFVQNEQLFDTEYNALISVMNTAQSQQTDQMHANFVTFFYGGTLPYAVTLTMEDSTTETFTVGQVITGVKPAYDTMILNEQAALQAMANFDAVAAELQTGNTQGIKEDETGGDDDAGLDGLEEYAWEIGEYGETAMDAMIVLNKIRDTAGEYLLESDTSNLTAIEQEFNSLVVEFDVLLYDMDVLAERIDGTTTNSPANKLLTEVRRIRDFYGQFLDWATDGTISGISYSTISDSNLGMFEQHDIELQKYTEYGQKMEDTDAAGTLLFAQIDTNATLSSNATLRDLVWEQLMTVNDYTITGDAAEKTAFTTISTQIQALPYYSQFQTEHQAVITEGTLCINAYDAWVSAKINLKNAMDEFDILGDKIEYGDTDYLLVGTTYTNEGSIDPTSTTDPATIGDDRGLDYLEWRGDIYGEVDETSMTLSYHLKEQQDLAGEYLLEEDISSLASIETEFMDSAETFDGYIDELLTFSLWMNDDTVLQALATESATDHDDFLDMAIDIDWAWTTVDETDSSQDGMFTAHYNDLVGDQEMMDQLEDFDAMASEIATVLESLEASVQITMLQSETELNLAFDAADYSMELKTLLVQQMDTAGEYLLEDNQTGLPSIENDFNNFADEFDSLANNFTALVDDGIAGQNQEEALVAEVLVDHDNFVDYATDDPTMDNNQLHGGMFEAHDDELAAIDSANLAMENLDSQAESLAQNLEALEITAANEMDQAQKDAENTANLAIIMLLSIAVIAVIIGISLGIVISRGITKPVNKLADGSKSLAVGDFGVELDVKAGKDEIGDMVNAYQGMLSNTAVPLRELNNVAQAIANGDLTKDIKVQGKGEIDQMVTAFKRMQENLRGLVKEIKSTAGSVASTSQELASSAEEMNASTQQVSSAIQQISKGSQSQAAQVEDTANIMKEMSTSVQDVADRSKSSADTSKKMTDSAESGRKAVTDAVSKMQEIQKVVVDSASTIEGLGKRSEEISQIVDVITNITDQTNLLALNAAIEAARAGEHGRGFAVVAEEVKNLAEDSKEAAERIATMIKEIQDDTGKAVEAMQHGTKEVEEGIEVVNLTDKSFEEITSMATTTNDQVQAISVATDQQMSGTDRIAKSIDSVASIAEESASASEESASSTEELTASMEDMTARAQELSEMAVSLQRTTNQFVLEEDEYGQTRMTEGPQKTETPRAPKKNKKKRVVENQQPELSKKVKDSLKKRGIDLKEEESDEE